MNHVFTPIQGVCKIGFDYKHQILVLIDNLVSAAEDKEVAEHSFISNHSSSTALRGKLAFMPKVQIREDIS